MSRATCLTSHTSTGLFSVSHVFCLQSLLLRFLQQPASHPAVKTLSQQTRTIQRHFWQENPKIPKIIASNCWHESHDGRGGTPKKRSPVWAPGIQFRRNALSILGRVPNYISCTSSCQMLKVAWSSSWKSQSIRVPQRRTQVMETDFVGLNDGRTRVYEVFERTPTAIGTTRSKLTQIELNRIRCGWFNRIHLEERATASPF